MAWIRLRKSETNSWRSPRDVPGLLQLFQALLTLLARPWLQAVNYSWQGSYAIGNDYAYQRVFARELSAHARPGDVLLAISTSGNHHNTLRAIKVARERKVTVIGLTGDSAGANENRMRPLSIGPLQIKG